MRVAFSQRRKFTVSLLLSALGLVALVLVVLVANVTHDSLFHSHVLMAAPAPGQVASLPAETKPQASTITLPEGKLKAAGIRVEPARMVELPAEVLVAGMIEANPNRRVEIRPRVPG